MKSFLIIFLFLLIGGLCISLGVWRTLSRIDDCEKLGHSFAYCAFVWGGR